ncbi:MAG: RDD family protein [Williamsia sp.]|nr:RDD family protein [Williamsia sp.]
MYYATFLQRVIALAIDMILVIPLALLFAYSLNKITEGTYKHEFTFFLFLLAYLYFSVLETYSAGGQTLGKKIIGIGVTSSNYRKVNVLNTSVRFVGKLFLPVGFILYFVNNDKRCLHDFFANTKVIRK